MSSQFAQPLDRIGRRFDRGIRMDAHCGVDARKPLRQRHGAPASFDAGADGDHPRHAHLPGAGDDSVDVPGEIGKIEMGMGVDDHGCIFSPEHRGAMSVSSCRFGTPFATPNWR